ncbi:MAG: hypothetical protein H0W76_27040 [Pyrinomonadaceae bacterium]|nr:hypothetical protein [Pyrinomonadaceae bacterium]
MTYPPLQQQRLDAGLCRLCGMPRDKDGSTLHCVYHAALKRTQTQRRQARARRRGECINCGEARGEGGSLYRCRKCSDANTARTLERRRQGEGKR